MKEFDQKIAAKLKSHQYREVLTEEKVASFFDKLDATTAGGQSEISLWPEKKTSQFAVWKIAASLAILMTVAFFGYRFGEVQVTTSGEVSQTIKLPDGSQVHLNTATHISYNKLAWLFSRSVFLQGEAFFEVTKGEKFTVTSTLGSTHVLGTSFNILAGEDEYSVRCFTGKVAVSFPDTTQSILLTPGRGVRVKPGYRAIAFRFDRHAGMVWRSDKFYFDNEPLDKVLATLSQEYNIYVDHSRVSDTVRYTGFFDNSDLNKALKLICQPLGFQYTIKGDTILIKQK